MKYTSQNLICLRPTMRGFTLIELMVAMALSLFLIGGVVLMYASSKAAYLDSNQLSRLQENIRFASDYMVRDIRNAGFRDQMTLVFIEQIAIQEKVAETLDTDGDGIADELIVRYAGRGHCEEEFDNYRVVENRYFFDAATGELRCAGAALIDVDNDGFSDDYDQVADPSFTAGGTGRALVRGLTGLAFEVLLADGTSEVDEYECEEVDPGAALANRCLGVQIGIEFEGLRDLDNAGQFESRFVELTSTFRNSAIDQIYAPCVRLEERAGVSPGTWCP
ncbi:prepilin-type N-terminal cleavage/methylation domain-containing protein [Wenzhouxiangella sp. XN201]|uniref:PilW family protein n=1 Tax=Wenzhouxiangella sp. XN201 TaxID=2710755 RepID=UPI0013CADA8B|nr:prepilin-type N-terminal cleavage/methylation domain-containing protein [Wenzhouxiangella sp. XN201]NEZ02731.1 prepilin-type N-terminal cleavage/methylation domain-containing protein [Wenzhouxiangella sp. XN201]